MAKWIKVTDKLPKIGELVLSTDKRILHVSSKKPLSAKSILMLNELVKKVNNSSLIQIRHEKHFENGITKRIHLLSVMEQ